MGWSRGGEEIHPSTFKQSTIQSKHHFFGNLSISIVLMVGLWISPVMGGRTCWSRCSKLGCHECHVIPCRYNNVTTGPDRAWRQGTLNVLQAFVEGLWAYSMQKNCYFSTLTINFYMFNTKIRKFGRCILFKKCWFIHFFYFYCFKNFRTYSKFCFNIIGSGWCTPGSLDSVLQDPSTTNKSSFQGSWKKCLTIFMYCSFQHI